MEENKKTTIHLPPLLKQKRVTTVGIDKLTDTSNSFGLTIATHVKREPKRTANEIIGKPNPNQFEENSKACITAALLSIPNHVGPEPENERGPI